MLILVTLIVLFLVYVIAIRPRIMVWGATEAEVAAIYPGDSLIANPQGESTRAITINAPAAAVWPWIVQIGQGRGGFYSYDWLENLLRLDIHSADRIVTELQQLTVGDPIMLGKNGPEWRVAELQAGQALVLRIVDQKSKADPNPTAPDYYDATWAFMVLPLDAQRSRLVIRSRGATRPVAMRVMNAVLGPISFIMEERMLRGIKTRAERAARSGTAPAA